MSCSALLAGEMCVVVTGLPGTGKTQLVDTVAHVLHSTGWTITKFVARLPSDADFAALTGSAAILIDDADRLSATELRTLNRLRQCSVLLAGSIGFEKRCPADSRVTLAPLPLEEVATYAALWLERAGLNRDLVAEPAIRHLAEVSAGIPRVLAILLAASLKGARADGSNQIEQHHIDNAAWHHVEYTAARRLHRATSTAGPGHSPPPPENLDADLESRLSQAPFADPGASERPTRHLLSRVLSVAGVALIGGLVIAAGVITWPQWSRWATATYGSFLSTRNEAAIGTTPAGLPNVVALPPVPEPAVAAHAASPIEQPGPIEAESVPPVAVMPAAVPAPAQAPPDPIPQPIAASPPPLERSLEPSAPSAAAPPHDPLDTAMIQLLNQRGQQMIALNDFSAARLLFSRAAEAGSVKAMLALGRSFDPNVTGALPSVADMDPAKAAEWYRKAAALGSSDAAIFLQQLGRGPRE